MIKICKSKSSVMEKNDMEREFMLKTRKQNLVPTIMLRRQNTFITNINPIFN
jgi:hypothetical protein